VVFPSAGCAGHCLGFRIAPSLRVQSPSRVLTQSSLAIRPQPVGSSHGLLVPSAHQETKVHSTRACRPATFRLQGLITLLAVSSLRIRAGFLSHRRRSWDSPFGVFPSRKVSGTFPPGSTHIPFRPASDPAAVAESRPNGLRFLGFDPFESPLRPGEGLARRPPDTPMGFALSGFLIASLGQRFSRPPLLRFVVPVASHETDRRHRVSINRRPAQPASRRSAPTRPGHPLRVFAPTRSRYIRTRCLPGYVFTLHCGDVTAVLPVIFGRPRCPTGVAGIG
jgi:hypothetical protein